MLLGRTATERRGVKRKCSVPAVVVVISYEINLCGCVRVRHHESTIHALFTAVNNYFHLLRIILLTRVNILIILTVTMLLTLPQVAERLSISRQRVWLLVTQGRIKAQRIGQAWLVHERELSKRNGHKRAGRPRKAGK